MKREISTVTVVYGTTIGSSTWSFLRGQLGHFHRRGAQVHAISSPDRLFYAAGEREGVYTHPIPMQREISPGSDVIALVRWMKALRGIKPDVINVGTPKAGLLGLIASWILKVPIRVYTVRGLRYETTTGRKRAILTAIEGLCCRLATHVIAVGHGVAEQMKSDQITSERIIVIGDGSSNGVPGEAISKAADALDLHYCRELLRIPADAFVLGFVGRIMPDKGGNTLSDAIKIVRQRRSDIPVVLLIVGDVEDDISAGILRGIQCETAHTGWIDDPVPAFRAMDALCLPTRREGFPNVVLEAGAVGIPTITTTATGARESVLHEVTGLLIEIDDADELASAIIRLADYPELRTQLGSSARERVLLKFKPDRIWDSLEDIYLGRELTDVTYY